MPKGVLRAFPRTARLDVWQARDSPVVVALSHLAADPLTDLEFLRVGCPADGDPRRLLAPLKVGVAPLY